jgi:hypothetical protein
MKHPSVEDSAFRMPLAIYPALARIMIQKTGQDVGKVGTDSFPPEEAYTHFLNLKIQEQT